MTTSGFLPRVRALRCAHPSFWAHCHAKQGAARPPPIAALLLFLRIPKIKIIYLTRAACVKGLLLSTLLPRPESTQRARPSIQPSALGPPTPSTAKDCGSPPRWIQGGRHTHIRMRGWGGYQIRRWGIHSGTPAPHIAASLIFPANIK
jgi:hypothetical protein